MLLDKDEFLAFVLVFVAVVNGEREEADVDKWYRRGLDATNHVREEGRYCNLPAMVAWIRMTGVGLLVLSLLV